MVTPNELNRTNARAIRRHAAGPKAVAARYDRRSDRIVVGLSSGIDISFSPRHAQGLDEAKAAELAAIEISPSGLGLHFTKLDADLYLPPLLEGFLGSKRWMAAHLGERGGQARSKAKAAASRRNGKLGGRPLKPARA
jgi:Protein of unknown function (DUF2442)